MTIASTQFDEVLALIEAARGRAYQLVNAELIKLYWRLGEYISKKIERAEWGDGVVDELADEIAKRYPSLRGYTRRNLFRMRQFFEAYRAEKKVSSLLTQLPWTHHLTILGRAKHPAEREFYVLAAIKERWTVKELDRQISTSALLRSGTKKKALLALRALGSSLRAEAADAAGSSPGPSGRESNRSHDLRC